jgi:lysophospholipase L1-like esterase
VPLSIFTQIGIRISGSKAAVPAAESDDDVPTVDSPVKKAEPKRTRSVIFSKPAQTIFCVLVFASLPLLFPGLANVIPGLKEYREMMPDLRELVSFKGSESNQGGGDIPGGAPTSATNEFASTGADAPVIVSGSEHPIEDPARALDAFFAHLARTENRQPGAITRITHYGDSPITNDGITSTVRRIMQERFGDAGHGFILMDKPWEWYGHQGITFSSGGDWDSNPIIGGKVNDGEFGLGGVSFRASGPGKYASFAPASEGQTGRNFSRMEVYYLQQPGGGQFSVDVNGTSAQSVSTSSDTSTSGFYEIKAPQVGPNTFNVKTLGGNVRLFGAVIENEGPGVVYDSLGVNGAYAGLLATAMNQEHWAQQLQHRNPNLVIINYGTNESQYASDEQMERYDKDLREVIRRVRAALSDVSILIVSPMDRGKRTGGGTVITMPSIPKIVEMQRRVALDTNCAFFNTFEAMGGDGTMAKWAAGKGKNHLVGGDLTHPTAEGSEIVGRLIFEGLNDSYLKYKARTAPGAQPMVAQK